MLAFSMRRFFYGVVVAAIGGLIWASNLGYVSVSFRFGRDWPIIIVGIGLMSIWDALFGRQWWGHMFHGRSRERRDDLLKVLEDLEKGNIDAEEAARRMGE